MNSDMKMTTDANMETKTNANAPIDTKTISRRQILKGTGALVVAFNLFDPISQVFAQVAPGAPGARSDEPQAGALDSWIAIGRDGKVTVFTSKVDLGTGIETALSQIVAEELDVPIQGYPHGSGRHDEDRRSRRHRRQPDHRTRRAAVAASRRGNAPAALEDGRGKTGSPRRSAHRHRRRDQRHGQRQKGVVWQPCRRQAIQRANSRDRRRLGPKNGAGCSRQEIPRTTRSWARRCRASTCRRSSRRFRYTQDVRIPGMLHGRVVRPPVVNSKPTSVDESSIKQIAGVVKVVQENFVGVVAQTEWAAIQAAKALKVTWSTPRRNARQSRRALRLFKEHEELQRSNGGQ